jgi:hypothetical protein
MTVFLHMKPNVLIFALTASAREDKPQADHSVTLG